VERAGTADGSTPGLMTWYDYPGKAGANNTIGTNGMPSFVAVILADGSTSWFHQFTWNANDTPAQDIEGFYASGGSSDTAPTATTTARMASISHCKSALWASR